MPSIPYHFGPPEVPRPNPPPQAARLPGRPGRKLGAVSRPAPAHLLAKCDQRFLGRLVRRPRTKLQLQQSLWRHFPAGIFHFIFERHLAEGRILIDHDLCYLTRQGAAAIERENGNRLFCLRGCFVEFAGLDSDPVTSRPVFYYKYFLTARPAPQARSWIVTNRPVTRATPILPAHILGIAGPGGRGGILVRNSGLDEALSEAAGQLLNLFLQPCRTCRFLP
jgi:hypothetical protein